MKISVLQEKNLADLKDIARDMGLTGYSTLRKQDLIYLILEAEAEAAAGGNGASRSRSRRSKAEAAPAEGDGADVVAEPDRAERRPRRRRPPRRPGATPLPRAPRRAALEAGQAGRFRGSPLAACGPGRRGAAP